MVLTCCPVLCSFYSEHFGEGSMAQEEDGAREQAMEGGYWLGPFIAV